MVRLKMQKSHVKKVEDIANEFQILNFFPDKIHIYGYDY